MRKNGYLLPIRAEWCAKIFDVQRKFFEYRKMFDATFKGRVFVYESGKDGCHKVKGFFDTERIAKVVPAELVPEDFDKLLDSVPEDIVDEVLSLGQPIYCVPIFHPVQFCDPLTLEEFSKRFNLDKIWTFPPHSRAKITYDDTDERLNKLKIKVAKQADGAKPPFVL